MNWKPIKTAQDLEEAKNNSQQQPVVIFKHSTSCSISSMALNRLERNWKDSEMQHIQPYFLDLLQHRDLSQAIAQTYDVRHESPQLLLIENGVCSYHTSHMQISYDSLKGQLQE